MANVTSGGSLRGRINDRDPAEVAQEHNRSQEMVEKNVRRAKERKQELEDAGVEV